MQELAYFGHMCFVQCIPAKGFTQTPMTPFPNPLVAPMAPSSRAPVMGWVMSPEMPS